MEPKAPTAADEWAIQDSAPERSEEVTLGCRGQCPRVSACGRHHRPRGRGGGAEGSDRRGRVGDTGLEPVTSSV